MRGTMATREPHFNTVFVGDCSAIAAPYIKIGDFKLFIDSVCEP
jgi:hypothetical protein